MEKTLTLSVHQLVDFLLRRGDIDSRVYNQASMSEGTRLHSYYQKQQLSGYLSEYSLEETFIVNDFTVKLQGRADGIIQMPFLSMIDEIKTTVINLEDYFESQKEWHLGQAKCYALMYANEKKLDRIGVRLTYIHQLHKEQKIKQFTYERIELEDFVISLIKEYLDFYQRLFDLKVARNQTAKQLGFPFAKFRQGQRELAKYTYNVLNQGGILYVEAPTGIGKTMSTLYPAIKTLANEENDKIFYLTAKTSGRESAYKAGIILKEKGLKAKIIIITAKDKICACPGRACNPDDCIFAKGYYDRLKPTLEKAIVEYDNYDLETVSKIAMEAQICPFEFELDLSLFCDIIVCDFNYLFDPVVYLKRYFDNDGTRFIALIDEAHNLVDRSRDMYTCSISYSNFKQMKISIKNSQHKKVKASTRKLNKILGDLRKSLAEGEHQSKDIDPVIIAALSNHLKASQDFMKMEPFGIGDNFKSFFFEVNKFLKILEFYGDNFTNFIKVSANDMTITLFALDPSRLIKDSLLMLKGAVLFSGTLSPLDYYVKMLGGDETSPVLKIASPFPRENLLLMVAPTVATTYKKRGETYEEVSRYIKTAIQAKVGNYFVFFPSYLYLQSVQVFFNDEEIDIHIQDRDMSDERKQIFLNQFVENPDKTHLAFVVLGGSFSEGIDLVATRLIGAIIVGVGLPQISFERNLIKDYFETKEKNGFEYSYVNPGMNRVMQAVGRVIRSAEDRGIVLLLDDRYLQSRYRNLFKSEWDNYEVVTSLDDVIEQTEEFWK